MNVDKLDFEEFWKEDGQSWVRSTGFPAGGTIIRNIFFLEISFHINFRNHFYSQNSYSVKKKTQSSHGTEH